MIKDREEAIRVAELDYRDYSECLDNLVKDKEKDTTKYKIIYRTILPYVTPIAAQECFTIYRDRLGNKINDPYVGAEKRIQVVHLCIFPYDGQTTVLMFYDVTDTSYDTLYEQFLSSTEDENLRYINYYMLAFGENYFYSERINKIILQDNSLKKVSQEYIGERGNFGVTTLMESVIYNPVKYNEIPFLLGKEFAL